MARARADVLFSLAILALAVWMVIQASGWPSHSRVFPLAVGVPMVVLAAIQLIRSSARLRLPRTLSDPPPPTDVADEEAVGHVPEFGLALAPSVEVQDEESVVTLRRLLEMSGWILLFTGGVIVLGFTLASLILTVAFLALAAHEKWRTTIFASLGVYVAFTFGFGHLLHVPFPDGIIADLLNLGAAPDIFLIDRVSELL